MAQRFGLNTIKDALVTLIGTTNVSDLNSGLTTSVKQVITKKPDELVIPVTMYPTVNIWSSRGTMSFRGASTRRARTDELQIDFWVRNMKSIDAAKDEAEILLDNILYILDGSVKIGAIVNGYLNAASWVINYDEKEGFNAHGTIIVEAWRLLN